MQPQMRHHLMIVALILGLLLTGLMMADLWQHYQAAQDRKHSDRERPTALGPQ